MTSQVSHPYKSTDFTQILNILILVSFHNNLDSHTLLNLQNDPLAFRILALTSLLVPPFSATILPKLQKYDDYVINALPIFCSWVDCISRLVACYMFRLSHHPPVYLYVIMIHIDTVWGGFFCGIMMYWATGRTLSHVFTRLVIGQWWRYTLFLLFLSQKTRFYQKMPTSKINSAAWSGGEGKLTPFSVTSIGLLLRQLCLFQSFVSYFHAAYDPLICERNYPTAYINLSAPELFFFLNFSTPCM